MSVLVFCLGVVLAPACARAESLGDTAGIFDGKTEQSAFVDDYDYDNDELFEGYAAGVFGMNDDISLMSSNYQENRLAGNDLKLYQYLKTQIKKVADGELNLAVFDFPINQLADQFVYTIDELGGSGLTAEEIEKAMWGTLDFDAKTIFYALLGDCPYELYWHDKTVGITWAYPEIKQKGQSFCYDEDAVVRFYFCVERKYSVGGVAKTVRVNTTETGKAKRAAENARELVAESEHLSDIDKLWNYHTSICDLVKYDTEAASAGSGEYGTVSPWQLIWVFDGDPDTNVVCEGYSKAFQYLCELTEFDSEDIFSLLVSGKADGGDHMWNVVHMDDGNNYLLDVTNSDTVNESLRTQLFLKGYNNIVISGDAPSYYVKVQSLNTQVCYVYDDETLAMYYMKDIAICKDDYDLHRYSSAVHTFDGNGACTVCERKRTTIEFDEDYSLTKKYDGESFALPTEAELNITGAAYEDVEFTWYKDSVNVENKLPGAPVNVGSYYLTASVAGTETQVPSKAVSGEITIEKGIPKIFPPEEYRIDCRETLVNIELPDGYAWDNPDAVLEFGADNEVTLTYTPEDLDNYEIITGITVNVHRMNHEWQELEDEKYLKSEATCTAPAVYYKSCKWCGIESDVEYESGDPIPHEFTDYKSDENATCGADGTKTAVCDYGCGAEDTVPDVGSQLEHSYVDDSYDWEEDGSACVVTLVCNRVGCTALTEGHTVNHDCEISSEVKTAATCSEQGTTRYTAVYGEFSNTKDVADIPIDLNNHPFKNGVCSGCGIRDITYKGIQISGLTLTYTGSPQLPAVVLKDADGTVIPADVYTVDAKAQTVVGTYTLTISANEDSGYVGEREESWVIRKAVPEYTKPAGYDITCDKSLKDITLPEGFTFDKPNMTLTAGKANAVSVTFTPEDTANYETVSGIEILVKVSAHVFDAEVVADRYKKSDATCMKGSIYYVSCSVCGARGTDEFEAGSVVDHSYKAYKSDGNVTCLEDGTKTAPCIYGCGKTDTVLDENSKLGHHYADAVTMPATVSADGMSYRECERCGDKTEVRVIPSVKSVKLSATSYVYSGSAKNPAVTVKDREGNELAADSYSVTYSDNKKVGEATVTVTFTGDYEGTATKTFQIVPKATSLVKVKAKSKAIDITWKKQTSQTTGYRIQYSTKKNFAGAKTKLIAKNKTTKLTLKKLKGKKKYYIRISTYKTVKINGKSKKIYSAWSPKKSVTTKR